MNLPQISSYEVKTSRTEQKVPVVNGVHLHSIYNPFKEAETLIDNQIEILKNKNEVLVLGLGFAYHVNYIIEKLTEYHGNNFKIVVIEPSLQVHQDCLEFGLLNKKNVLIYSSFTSSELYSDIELVNFLLRKPAMIAHPPSFNLYQYYFKTFLTFEAPVQIEEIIKSTEVLEVKKYLQSFDGHMSFEDAVYQGLPLKKSFTSMDFLAMAMVEMTKGSLEQTSGESES
jgi:hypothetical protein